MAIRLPGLKNLDKPILWLFPELLTCLYCEFTVFLITKEKLCVFEGEQRGATAVG